MLSISYVSEFGFLDFVCIVGDTKRNLVGAKALPLVVGSARGS